MRILYSHRIQSRNGQTVHVEELIDAFRQEGHEVRVVGTNFHDERSQTSSASPAGVLRRRLPPWVSELAELSYNIPAFFRLRRAAAEFQPDIIYERNNLYYLGGSLLARYTGLPLILEVNAPFAHERTTLGLLKLGSLARRLERYVWRSADWVLAVSGVLRDTLIVEGADPKRVQVLHNGVVLERFSKATTDPKEVVSNDRPLTLGFVGFARPWHGLDKLLDSIASYHGPRKVGLTVVGDGPSRADLEAQAARLGIADRVHFTGAVPYADVPEYLPELDIALQPGVQAYASPMKIFDYMAAGRAIVAPDQPNIREVLEDGRTALLFDPSQEGAMWEQIQRLLDDPGLRERLGVAARSELEDRNFTWRGNANHIAELAASVEAPIGRRSNLPNGR